MSKSEKKDLDDQRTISGLLIAAVGGPPTTLLGQIGLFVIAVLTVSLGVSQPFSSGSDGGWPELIANAAVKLIPVIGLFYAVAAISSIAYLKRNGFQGGNSILVACCCVVNATLFALNTYIGWGVITH
ncbi:MAG: hypothetical protein KBG84_00515 [Planctomycetes bacterium]|jgi:hypothetical protein|nr:hypothetical protein [Planctomycetota bacterium]